MTEMGQICPACGRRIPLGSKLFEGYMAELFLEAVSFSRDTEVQWKEDRANPKSPIKTEFLKNVVFAKDLRQSGQTTRYARVGDLKLWGLLSQNPNHWHQGIYQITTLAREFINGSAVISKRLVVSNGKVIEQSKEKISLREALGTKWNEVANWISDWRQKHTQWDENTGQGRML